MFEGESVDSIINILKEIPHLSPLGKSLPALYNKALLENDTKTLESIREVFWSWSNGDIDEFARYLGRGNLNTYLISTEESELHDKVLKAFKVFSVEEGSGIINSYDSSILTSMPLENLKKMTILDYIEYLGYPVNIVTKFFEKSGVYYNYNQTVVQRLRTLYSTVVRNLADRGEEYRRYVIEKFFKPFEDEETTMDLTSNLMELNASKSAYVRKFSVWGGDGKDNLVLFSFMALIDILIESAEKLYNDDEADRLNMLKENFKNLKDTINLVCAFDQN